MDMTNQKMRLQSATAIAVIVQILIQSYATHYVPKDITYLMSMKKVDKSAQHAQITASHALPVKTNSDKQSTFFSGLKKNRWERRFVLLHV